MVTTTAGIRGSRRLGSEITGRACAAFLAIGGLISGAGTAPVLGAETLQWKFKEGETLRYTMEQQTSQGIKAMGQEFKTSINQTVNLHWTVKKVAGDGVAELSQTIDRVRTKIQGPGPQFEFDSDAAQAPEGQIATLLVPLFKAMVGAEFSFKINGRGELTDVKVPQKLVETIKQAGPAAAAGGMFSEEGLKNLISQSSLALPTTPLDPGKSWTQQSKVPLPMIGTMVMDKTYTYQGPGADNPRMKKISLGTKVSLEPAADSNVAVKITSQEGKGEFSFDSEAGRVASSKVNDKLQMSLSVQGQELEQSTETATTMRLEGSASSSK